MQKDLKIGLVLGLALVITAVLWLATRPNLSPQSELADVPDVVLPQESVAPPAPVATSEPNLASTRLPEAAPTQPTQQPDLTRYEQAEKIKTQRFHIIQRGETLSKISAQYYGSAGKWRKILEANRETIKDADKLTVGTKIIIPD